MGISKDISYESKSNPSIIKTFDSSFISKPCLHSFNRKKIALILSHFITLKSSFPSPNLFLWFSASNQMGKIVNSGTQSSLSQQSPAVFKDPVMADCCNKEFILIGSIPVSLDRKEVKNNVSLPPTPSCTSFVGKKSELMSSSNHSVTPWIATTSVRPRKSKRRTRIDLGFSHASGDSCSVQSCNVENRGLPYTKKFSTSNETNYNDESPEGSNSWKKRDASFNSPYYNIPSNSNDAVVGINLESQVGTPKFKPFDICFRGKRNSPLIGATLPGGNKEMFVEMQEKVIKEGILLGPGMVLLKNYITHDEQVKIVNVCRELGVGPGGFYQPGYANGAKLRLKMMCLGKDWDPQTYKYGKKRVIDGSEPPSIPNHFTELVLRSIKEAHSLIKKECKVWNVEDELPSMTPDICIINFYTSNGKLGLHQDRDESRESLRKGLPVVSFSIGDSAEFLYGDQRDVEMAERVLLESGDVLIFGGESRHVFHGVSSVIPNSAPQKLLRDSCLIPGRLNLTFRQY
ncbi:hypothetical protein Fmac_012078 [Flemingia macrophylla]|uniref:DNA N(6)-methyladenine demethylase n=1 Tax=Flemingia macrophylla TaxID=520843 RepID=A0ABD1MP95_9FABA